MNMTSLECAYLSCQRTVHSGQLLNDVVLSWGMLVTAWWDAFVHVYVLTKEIVPQMSVRRERGGEKEEKEREVREEREDEKERSEKSPSSRVEELRKTLRDFVTFRIPARVLISFFSNLFLGTLTSIAGYVSLIQSANEIANLIPSNNTETSQFEGLIDFTAELSKSIKVTAYVAIPISYSLFVISTFLCLLAFHRDARKVCKDPPLKRLDISFTPLFVGAFISNCLFGLAFHWLIFGLIVFSFANSYIRTFIFSSWNFFLLMSISPIVTYLSRVIFLEKLFATPEKGISHPKWYRFGDFSLILSSSIAGPVYGLTRIVISLFFLLILVHRVDYSIVPHPFQDWDFVYLYYRQVLNVYKMNQEVKSQKREQRRNVSESSRDLKQESDPLVSVQKKEMTENENVKRENREKTEGSVQYIYVVVDQ